MKNRLLIQHLTNQGRLLLREGGGYSWYVNRLRIEDQQSLVMKRYMIFWYGRSAEISVSHIHMNVIDKPNNCLYLPLYC